MLEVDKFLDADKTRNIQSGVLDGYKIYQRSFPWRLEDDPFKILVAEKLLQQTRAGDVVVEVYQKIIKCYPSPSALAEAEVKDIENLIKPLGLHFRAHHLKKMSEEIIERYSGEVPDKFEDLMGLTGVGEYCANAVLCFAFYRELPIVDTNVARFIHRLIGIDGPIPVNPSRKKYLYKLASRIIPAGKAKEFNYAILDLCSEYCKSANPKCDGCPLKSLCRFAEKK